MNKVQSLISRDSQFWRGATHVCRYMVGTVVDEMPELCPEHHEVTEEKHHSGWEVRGPEVRQFCWRM